MSLFSGEWLYLYLSGYSDELASMWPLLKRDGLGVQYIATLLLWNRLIGYNPFRLPQRSFIQLLSIVSARILL